MADIPKVGESVPLPTAVEQPVQAQPAPEQSYRPEDDPRPTRMPRYVPLPSKVTGGRTGMPTQLLAPDEDLYVEGAPADDVRATLDRAAAVWGGQPQNWKGLEVHVGSDIEGDSNHTGRTLVRKGNGQVMGGRMDIRMPQDGRFDESSVLHEVGHLILGGDYDHKDPRWRSKAFWRDAAKQMGVGLDAYDPYRVDWQGYAQGGEVEVTGAQMPAIGQSIPLPSLPAVGQSVPLPGAAQAPQAAPQLPEVGQSVPLATAPAQPEPIQLDPLGRPAQPAIAAPGGPDSGAGVAALEGAAETLSFGLSPLVERAFGRDMADYRRTAEAHPWARGAGEVGGFVLPALLSWGASLGPQTAANIGVRGAMRVLAPTLIAEAGGAIERAAVAKGLAGLGGAMVSTAARWGTEGALLGASDAVAHLAMGDPNTTAQSIVADIGLSGLIGGAGGALAAPVGRALQAAVKPLEEFAGVRNIKAAGAIQSDMARAEQKLSPEGLYQVGRELEQYGLVGPSMTNKDTYLAAKALKKDTGAKMGELLDKVGATAPKVDFVQEVVSPARLNVLPKLQHNPLQRSVAENLEKTLDGMATEYAAPMSLKDLHVVRQNLDDAIYGVKGSMDPHRNVLTEALSRVRGLVDDAIDKNVNTVLAGTQDAGQDVLKYWNYLNRKFQVASYAQKWGLRGMQRGEGNNLISLTEGLAGGFAGSIFGGGDDGDWLTRLEHGGLGFVGGTVGLGILRRRFSAFAGPTAQRMANLIKLGTKDATRVPYIKAFYDRNPAATMTLLSALSHDPLGQENAMLTIAKRLDNLQLKVGQAAAAAVGNPPPKPPLGGGPSGLPPPIGPGGMPPGTGGGGGGLGGGGSSFRNLQGGSFPGAPPSLGGTSAPLPPIGPGGMPPTVPPIGPGGLPPGFQPPGGDLSLEERQRQLRESLNRLVEGNEFGLKFAGGGVVARELAEDSLHAIESWGAGRAAREAVEAAEPDVFIAGRNGVFHDAPKTGLRAVDDVMARMRELEGAAPAAALDVDLQAAARAQQNAELAVAQSVLAKEPIIQQPPALPVSTPVGSVDVGPAAAQQLGLPGVAPTPSLAELPRQQAYFDTSPTVDSDLVVKWREKFLSNDPAQRLEAVREAVGNPNILHEALLKNTAPLFQYAPSHVEAIHEAAQAQMDYLHSKAPQLPEKELLDRQTHIDSPADLAVWNRYFSVAADPMSVFKHLKAGTLTPQHVEALQVLYPDLHSTMQTHLLQEISNKLNSKKSVDRKLQLGLSMLLGQSASSSLKPEAIRANQAVFQGVSKQSEQMGQPIRNNSSAVAKIKGPSRLQTPQQRLQERSV